MNLTRIDKIMMIWGRKDNNQGKRKVKKDKMIISRNIKKKSWWCRGGRITTRGREERGQELPSQVFQPFESLRGEAGEDILAHKYSFLQIFLHTNILTYKYSYTQIFLLTNILRYKYSYIQIFLQKNIVTYKYFYIQIFLHMSRFNSTVLVNISETFPSVNILVYICIVVFKCKCKRVSIACGYHP